MKEEKWGFHLVMTWASETSTPLSDIANRDPLYQSTTIRLGRTSTWNVTGIRAPSVPSPLSLTLWAGSARLDGLPTYASAPRLRARLRRLCELYDRVGAHEQRGDPHHDRDREDDEGVPAQTLDD